MIKICTSLRLTGWLYLTSYASICNLNESVHIKMIMNRYLLHTVWVGMVNVI